MLKGFLRTTSKPKASTEPPKYTELAGKPHED